MGPTLPSLPAGPLSAAHHSSSVFVGDDYMHGTEEPRQLCPAAEFTGHQTVT